MALVKVRNDNVTIEIPDGERLFPYLENNSGLPFGCRKGKCGMCACVIISGENNLNDKSMAENETLAKTGSPNSKKNRLACLLRIKHGEVELEY